MRNLVNLFLVTVLSIVVSSLPFGMAVDLYGKSVKGCIAFGALGVSIFIVSFTIFYVFIRRTED